MIKRYTEFISENKEDFQSLPEYIESLSKESDYAMSVVSDYIKDIDPKIGIASAVSTLDEYTQNLIVKMIEDEKLGLDTDHSVEVNTFTTTSFNESQEIGGKNIFKCFLKVISALGQKDCECDWKRSEEDFIFLFVTNLVNWNDMSDIMSRYMYFDNFIKNYKSDTQFVRLYFGLRTDMKFDYGVMLNEQKVSLGNFLLTQGSYNFIMTLNLMSASNLKKLLVSFSIDKLSVLSKIKLTMKRFFPGQSDNKMSPVINGDIISYAYQGLGNWDNGTLDSGEVENIKNNLRNFLMSHKWSDKVQFSVVPTDSWVHINIKLK